MAVINLGQFGEPRKSDLSGLSEAIGKGVEIGETRKRTGILKQQANTQAQESNTKMQQLKLSLSKEEQAEKTRGRALAEKAHKALSLRLMGKSESEQQIVLESDPIKAITKDLFKAYMPEIIDEKSGLPIPDRLTFIPKTPEEARDIAVKTKEAMNEIEAKRIPILTQISAMRKNVMTEAYMMGTMETPPVQEQLKYLDQIQAAAEKVFQDANPNIFTNSLGGGAGQDVGDWWNK